MGNLRSVRKTQQSRAARRANDASGSDGPSHSRNACMMSAVGPRATQGYVRTKGHGAPISCAAQKIQKNVWLTNS